MTAQPPFSTLQQLQGFATAKATEIAASYPGLRVEILHWQGITDGELPAEGAAPPPDRYALEFRAGRLGDWERGAAEIPADVVAAYLTDEAARQTASERLVDGLSRTARAAAERLGIPAAAPGSDRRDE